MPVCDICSQELPCDSELKTHLLLKHTENETACPLCPLSGVSYDELNFHINTAHAELAAQGAAAPRDPKPSDKGSGPASVSGSSLSSASPLNARGESEDGREDVSACRKPKQKRLSSPRKERTFSCPLCDLVCTDCFVLQEHVELHLQAQSPSRGPAGGFVCPLCALVCEDGGALQEHVDLHLEHASPGSGDVSGDLRLAQRLHEEEERKRKEEEAKREAADFKELQRQFGVDSGGGGGGYRKQMERNMERAVSRGQITPSEFHAKRAEMMETLASGLDDGRTRTAGLVAALYQHYQREIRDGTRVWLCSESDHFSSSEGDRGWGCGYRNFQMLLSCLHRLEPYATLHTLPDSLPSIPRVQALIEAAWAQGIDPQGASQFDRRLEGTRAWIGATEIYAALTSLRLRARIVDFHQPTGPGDTHPRLFDWVKRYFSLPFSGGPGRTPPGVLKTNLPPVYLQHQGHSRSIVGLEERRNGTVCLLLFDPACPPAEMRKLLIPGAGPSCFNRLRRFPGHLKHKQYQVVVVEGTLSEQEKRERVSKSRTLRAERIP